jgi:branched-chain amino acid transport system substrate-binding protein
VKYLFFVLITLLPYQVHANDKVVNIYLDADISNHNESSSAIQKGIEIAFDEIGNEINGYKIIYKYLDHRGNVVRSKRNYQTFISDPLALVIYSGIHSAPLINNRTFINENKALTLVPWAAGGPITRHPSSENWIFRLSIDDTQAAPVIIDFALQEKSCKAPHLLLEETPWGDSNLKSMSKALQSNGVKNKSVTRFSWNIKSRGARSLLRDVINDNSDCIVLVGNAVEGAVIIGEMANFPKEQRLPIISHWGIAGGNFHEIVTKNQRSELDLHFIQTCFAFTNPVQTVLSRNVFAHVQEYSNGMISKPSDLKAAAGFIHAYDLTKLLIQAIRQVGLTGNMNVDRERVRLALESISAPVEGLVKTYIAPFSIFNEETNKNAHEALHTENYCMGRYGPSDEIVILMN